MSEEKNDVLAAAGRVEPPSPGALDQARERLWSAIAEEVLGTGERGGPATAIARRSKAPGQHRVRREERPGQ
ncbi:MAG: hypothetical protein ACRDZX_06620 [Acidimicrobiales bacterium]